MRKKIASLMLLLTFTIASVGVVSASIYNEKRYSQCHDADGKFIESKDCDPTSCGCLFHEIEEFIKGLFD
ncbi:MAG: hypothetical protein ACT4O9_00460 [Blastocatellia bacterium]